MHTTLYEKNLKDGKEYEKFIVDLFLKGLYYKIDIFQSVEAQYKGESKQGIEIKYDRMYDKTGNLWIELVEKTKSSNQNWIDSGIFKEDNTMFYLIGNYDEIYIFFKKYLCQISEKYKKIENNNKTSKGFLFKKEDAQKIAARILKEKIKITNNYLIIKKFNYNELKWKMVVPTLLNFQINKNEYRNEQLIDEKKYYNNHPLGNKEIVQWALKGIKI